VSFGIVEIELPFAVATDLRLFVAPVQPFCEVCASAAVDVGDARRCGSSRPECDGPALAGTLSMYSIQSVPSGDLHIPPSWSRRLSFRRCQYDVEAEDGLCKSGLRRREVRDAEAGVNQVSTTHWFAGGRSTLKLAVLLNESNAMALQDHGR